MLSTKNSKRAILAALVVLAAGSVGFLGWYLLSPRGIPSAKTESLTIGTVLLEPGSLIFVAEDQDLFARNGLRVTIRYYENGPAVLDGMRNGDIDVSSLVAEYVLVARAFKKEPIQAIANIDKVDYVLIVGRRSHGIQSPADLKGKRIGLVRGTMQEFLLGRYLDLHELNGQAVELVNGSLKECVDALIKGDIDAAVTVPPHLRTIQSALGNDAVVWPAQAGQALHNLVVCDREWIIQHPRPVERLLKSLNQAEAYILRYPDQTASILKKKMNLADLDAVELWSRNQFSLSLDQSLIVAMEDEARWMIANHLVDGPELPDFLPYLYLDGLKAIKPQSVRIIR